MKRFSLPLFLKKYGTFLLLSSALILFALLYFTGALRRSDADLLTQISYSIILAVSLNLVVGFLGELSLGHAGFMCVGAYVGCLFGNLLRSFLDAPIAVFLLSAFVGGLAAAVAGVLIGIPTLRLKGDYLAIVTLAFGEIVRTVVRNQPVFGGALGLKVKTFGPNLFIPGFLFALLTVFVVRNLMNGKHGRAIKAIRDSEIAAGSVGVDITKYKLLAFVIAAFFAGIAGVIYGNSVTPVRSSSFDFNYSINILVMVVLGGMGNIAGSVISAAALTYFDVKLTVTLPGNLAALKNLIYALILTLVVIRNNAPALAGFRSKFSFKNLFLRLSAGFGKGRKETDGPDDPSVVDWTTIPTKIKMDAILSADLVPDNAFEPDKEKKGADK